MSIFYILLSIVILGFIVVVHELGHYTAARLTGIAVDEFSVGFGPRLLGFQKSGIAYSLRLIPLGGYVRFVDDADTSPDVPVWKRILTVACGPLMNFVLAFVVAFLLYACVGLPTSMPLVDSVMPEAPAAQAGLQAGDKIVAVDDVEIPYSYEGYLLMSQTFAQHDPAQPLRLTVSRDGERISLETGLYTDETGRQILGIYVGSEKVRKSVGASLRYSFLYLKNVSTLMLDSLRNLIFKGEGIEDMSGPVGIIGFMSTSIRQSADIILDLIVFISLNLGIMNLLPLPALDGGRLVFLILEAIRRKPIPREKEGLVHLIGMGLLFVCFLLITYKDIVRLIVG